MPAPQGLPLRDGTRPLKRWRYVGVFGEDVMACAGLVRITGLPIAFWAVWDRRRGRLRQGTAFGPAAPRRVHVPDGRLRVRAPGVEIDLRLEPDTEPWEARNPHGSSWIWTEKTGVRSVGTVRVDGEADPVDCRALIDDTAGYHARVTAWDWCAGVGEDDAGRVLTWNLVTGVHDGPTGSERAVWVDGTPSEVGPVRFAGDLSRLEFGSGERLEFAAEAERARHDRGPLFESEYRQPFGTFAGTLPGGVRLARGFGVMERHRARW